MIDEFEERRKQGWKPDPDDFEIRSIMQRGDALRLPNATDTSAEGPTMPEKSSQAKKTEVLMGDHVTDEELEALLEAGFLGEI
jgi:hypothetical protein